MTWRNSLHLADLEARASVPQPEPDREVVVVEAPPVQEPVPDTTKIPRAEIASQDRFRFLIQRIVQASRAGEKMELKRYWYELASVAVALGDRIAVDEPPEGFIERDQPTHPRRFTRTR